MPGLTGEARWSALVGTGRDVAPDECRWSDGLTLNFRVDNIGAMLNEDVERVRTALSPLCEPFHDVFTWADDEARKRLDGDLLGGEHPYGWLVTHMTRALAHSRLDRQDLSPWKLTGNHAHNGELWLSDGQFRVRVLHSTSAIEIPAPGSNPRRRAYYCNRPMVQQLPLYGAAEDRLLILWRILPDVGPAFRVVRPIGTWSFGGVARVDLDFYLPDTADDLSDLRFDPVDEDLELPWDEDDEEGGKSAGGVAG